MTRSETKKLLPADARAHNRTLVLRTVLRTPDVSRADVARTTGLSRITVSDLVGGLVADGILVETGARASEGRPGKPATLLQVDPSAFAIIAVDLSQPHRFHGAVLTVTGDIVHRAEVTGDRTGAGAVTAVVELIDRLHSAAGARVAGIGIGSPGVVDSTGTVVESTNLGWRHLPLAAQIGDRYGVPTIVENDANAAVIAELDPDGSEDLLLVRIGTGLGGAAIVNGHLVRGANNAGGELGHITMAGPGDSEATVEATIRHLLEQGGDSELVERVGTVLGEQLAPAVAMLDVPEIVIEGPHGIDVAAIAAAAESAIARFRRIGIGRPCRVRPGSHDEDVVLIGMADLVLSRTISTI
ncbi:ROK family transcriptional regulator [Microbacterium dauci]|uniref:ROK family transcriptional regulator n=1 Tax=Microbacterium dauci TaxID=3048008 RepID=A0ABT6ZHE6_9MICO|nr:ROK family transcriptional regulator [Microbacterium sp. LX3-4]MDJ1115564.1 ROK family transcriptional regulator [Microbacterium sp. LX3-4]